MKNKRRALVHAGPVPASSRGVIAQADMGTGAQEKKGRSSPAVIKGCTRSSSKATTTTFELHPLDIEPEKNRKKERI